MAEIAPAAVVPLPKYQVFRENWQQQHASYVGPTNPQNPKWANGLEVSKWALGGCGLGLMQRFNTVNMFSSFADKALFMSLLYKELYTCGHVIYAITNNQESNPLHRALLEIGSTKIAEFPNLYHGPAYINVFLVNIRNCDGWFCDKYGEPFTEQPKQKPATPATHVTTPSNYNGVPVKPPKE